MGRLIGICLLASLVFSCGADDETAHSYSFPRAEVYPLYEYTYLTGDPVNRRHPSWSPDGNAIAFPERGDLWVISPSGGEPSKAVGTDGWVSNPYFVPLADANKLLFVDVITSPSYQSNTIFSYEEGQAEPSEIKSLRSRPRPPSWSYDGERIIYCFSPISEIEGVHLISADGRDSTMVPNEQGWENYIIYSVQANPAVNELIFFGKKNKVYSLFSLSLDSGEPIILHSFPSGYMLDPIDIAVSLDGSLVACVARYPSLYYNLFILPVAGGEPELITEFDDSAHPLYMGRPSWSPDGGKLVVEGNSVLYIVELKL